MGKRQPPPVTFRCGCGKIHSATERDAKRLRKWFARQHGHTNQVRYYQCGYGGWHWTRDVQRVGR